MKVIGLDGKEYKWNLSKFINNKRQSASKGHKKAREILKEEFPLTIVLEEVTIPGPDRMFADFYIQSERIMVEVHGEQHTKFTPFFFASRQEFYKAKARDRKKANWCELNDIELIQLFTNEGEDVWRAKIRER